MMKDRGDYIQSDALGGRASHWRVLGVVAVPIVPRLRGAPTRPCPLDDHRIEEAAGL